MDNKLDEQSRPDRRRFLAGVGAGLGLTAGSALAQDDKTSPETVSHAGVIRPLTDKEKVARIASNSYPIRFNFKVRNRESDAKSQEMQKKYGTLTLLDFPTFTKEHFPGVYQMDVWNSLFGDPSDDSMYVPVTFEANGKQRSWSEFDPSTPSSKKWLDQFASKCVTTGTKVHHISNNAPRDICELDETKRRAGVEVAKKWLDARGHSRGEIDARK